MPKQGTILLAVSSLAMGACGPQRSLVAQEPSRDEKPANALTQERHSQDAKNMNARLSKSNYDITPLSRERVAQLAAKLDPETYRVTQSAGTEPAFCGTLVDNHKEGTYVCSVCGLPLFSSKQKFDSGSGWPSFWREFDPQHVTRKSDSTHGMVRTEINCARCGSHLGHVFDDGPRPTGERHCLNSVSLKFYEDGQQLPPESRPVAAGTVAAPAGSAAMTAAAATGAMATGAQSAPATEVAYFAGGCFWGVEHYFQKGPGVIDAASGYMQGHLANPGYKEVCTDTTGHAETVKVVYDPSKITFRRLLEAFFVMHDPTQLNRQGPDVGDQYRSGIFYTSDAQRAEAEKYIKQLNARKAFGGRPIVTQIEPAQTFYPAEDYHQDYIAKTGRSCHVTNPWK